MKNGVKNQKIKVHIHIFLGIFLYSTSVKP
jgi:hypothetical protein